MNSKVKHPHSRVGVWMTRSAALLALALALAGIQPSCSAAEPTDPVRRTARHLGL
jgi:hypothetical protein